MVVRTLGSKLELDLEPGLESEQLELVVVAWPDLKPELELASVLGLELTRILVLVRSPSSDPLGLEPAPLGA